jgi:hypothetical protein
MTQSPRRTQAADARPSPRAAVPAYATFDATVPSSPGKPAIPHEPLAWDHRVDIRRESGIDTVDSAYYTLRRWQCAKATLDESKHIDESR